jgi:hypothetical protein
MEGAYYLSRDVLECCGAEVPKCGADVLRC